MKQEPDYGTSALNFQTKAIFGISLISLVRRVNACCGRILQLGRRAPRRLRLCESLPLGERRFVAVVEFDKTRFLVGGTPSSLVLLSRLQNASEAGVKAEAEAEAEAGAEAEAKTRRGERC